MNSKIISIILICILVIALGAGYYFGYDHGFEKEVPIEDPDNVTYCTQDAKMCPDGSYVGRTGPKCEFTACPNKEGLPPPQESGIEGKVLLGPTCPVMRDPPDPKCADKLYETSLAVTTVDGSRVVKTFRSDAKGVFIVTVPPGEYAIRSTATANTLPYCASNGAVKVVADQFTAIEVSCDTGIR